MEERIFKWKRLLLAACALIAVGILPVLLGFDRNQAMLGSMAIAVVLFTLSAVNWAMWRGEFYVSLGIALFHGLGILLPEPASKALVPGEARAAVLSFAWFLFACAALAFSSQA